VILGDPPKTLRDAATGSEVKTIVKSFAQQQKVGHGMTADVVRSVAAAPIPD
jgi:hypothetical protein